MDTRTLAGPKRRRKLQAVMVIASMKAITVDWLSSSKFGSARLTSQTALIAEMIGCGLSRFDRLAR